MVDTPLTGLVINIKVLQVVVEVDASGTEVSTEQSSVSGEDGRHVDVSFTTKRNGETSLPFVEVGNNGGFSLTGRELPLASRHAKFSRRTHLAQEPCHHVTENDGLVVLVVVTWGRDTGKVPQISLPLVHSSR